jgi:hypothetical protein
MAASRGLLCSISCSTSCSTPGCVMPVLPLILVQCLALMNSAAHGYHANRQQQRCKGSKCNCHLQTYRLDSENRLQ